MRMLVKEYSYRGSRAFKGGVAELQNRPEDLLGFQTQN